MMLFPITVSVLVIFWFVCGLFASMDQETLFKTIKPGEWEEWVEYCSVSLTKHTWYYFTFRNPKRLYSPELRKRF